MAVDNHIPLRYCEGFIPFRDYSYKNKIVVTLGEVITRSMIQNFAGDASKFIVDIRPIPNLAEKIKTNIEKFEEEEEEALERIVYRLEAGEDLFEEGDHDQMIYILLDGTLEVIKSDEVIAEIKEKGAFIGEMSTLRRQTRSAAVRALTEVKLYKFDGTDMLELAVRYPVILLKMCRAIANKLAQTDNALSATKMILKRTTTQVYYKPDHEKSNHDSVFASSMSKMKNKAVKFNKGQVLFEEGAASFEIYILVKGELRVSLAGETIARVATPGTLVGEMSILRGENRSATVVAESDCELYVLNGVRILELCKEIPGILIRLAEILANRLVATSEEYAKVLKLQGELL